MDEGDEVSGWGFGPWLPSIPFRTPAKTYCVEVDARSLITNETFRRGFCVDHEDQEGLWQVEPALDSALSTCQTPPPTLREQWCAELIAMCDTNPIGYYDSTACSTSRTWCDGEWIDRETPQMTYATPMDVCLDLEPPPAPQPPTESGSAGRGNTAPSGDGTGESDETVSVHGGGCGCTVARRIQANPLTLFCGCFAVLWLRARRSRRKRRR